MKKTSLRINLSIYLYPVVLLSLATLIFTYSRRKSRPVHILETHSLDSIRTRKSQKNLRAFAMLPLSSTAHRLH